MSHRQKFVDHLASMDRTESETYEAVCHCGTVRCSVVLSPPLPKQKVVSCNCTICARNGYLLVYPLRQQLVVESGEDALKTYSFGRKRNVHKFCGNCGSSVFFDPRMKDEQNGIPDLMGVNVRMIKNVKVNDLVIVEFDGLNSIPFVDSDHLQ